MNCYDFKVKTQYSESTGIVLAENPANACDIIRRMPEYRLLELKEVELKKFPNGKKIVFRMDGVC